MWGWAVWFRYTRGIARSCGIVIVLLLCRNFHACIFVTYRKKFYPDFLDKNAVAIRLLSFFVALLYAIICHWNIMFMYQIITISAPTSNMPRDKLWLHAIRFMTCWRKPSNHLSTLRLTQPSQPASFMYASIMSHFQPYRQNNKTSQQPQPLTVRWLYLNF